MASMTLGRKRERQKKKECQLVRSNYHFQAVALKGWEVGTHLLVITRWSRVSGTTTGNVTTISSLRQTELQI